MGSSEAPEARRGGPGGVVRAAVRVVGAVLVTLLAAPPVFGAWALGLGDRALGRRLRARVTCQWARLMLRVLFVDIVRSGDVPAAPCLVAPNHVSYLDILVLASLGPVAFVSRADVSGWPLIGPLARIAGTIFLERERRRDTHRAAGEIEQALADGVRVVVFLEGRAGPGDHVQPFRSSLVHPAVHVAVPCVPVRLRYTLPDRPDLDTRNVVAWHTGAPFPAHALRLSRAGPVRCDVAVLPPREGTDRKALARALEDDVRAALERRVADAVQPTRLSRR